MLLATEFIIIVFLIVILIMVIMEERKIEKSKIPKAVVKEFWDGPDRRQSARIEVPLVIRYCLEKKRNLRLSCQIKNISSGGMCLLLNEKLADETLLMFEFELPDVKKIISAEGRVVWSGGNFDDRDELGKRIFRTGIQFVNIKSDDRNKIAAYIEKITGEARGSS